MPIMGCWCDNHPCTCGETALRVSRNLDRPEPVRATEMVERVKAILRRSADWTASGRVGEDTAEKDMDEAAREIMRGMRQPTEAMAEAPWKAEISAGETSEGAVYIQPEAARQIWEAMIDEALK